MFGAYLIHEGAELRDMHNMLHWNPVHLGVIFCYGKKDKDMLTLLRDCGEQNDFIIAELGGGSGMFVRCHKSFVVNYSQEFSQVWTRSGTDRVNFDKDTREFIQFCIINVSLKSRRNAVAVGVIGFCHLGRPFSCWPPKVIQTVEQCIQDWGIVFLVGTFPDDPDGEFSAMCERRGAAARGPLHQAWRMDTQFAVADPRKKAHNLREQEADEEKDGEEKKKGGEKKADEEKEGGDVKDDEDKKADGEKKADDKDAGKEADKEAVEDKQEAAVAVEESVRKCAPLFIVAFGNTKELRGLL
jgi:hypothetical protein